MTDQELQEKKLNKFQEILKMLDESLTREEFESSFDDVLKYVKKIEKFLIEKIDTKMVDADSSVGKSIISLGLLQKEFRTIITEAKDVNKSTFKSFKRRAVENIDALFNSLRVEERLNKIIKDYKEKIGELDVNIQDLDRDELIEDVLAKITPAPTLEEIENLLPTSGEKFRDGLELLQGEERLSKDAVSGIDEIELSVKKLKDEVNKKPNTPGWGAHPLQIWNDGMVVDKIARVLNFKGDAVVSIVRNKDGTTDITLNAGINSVAWGTIMGTLSDQTDLQVALNAKLDDSQLDTDGTLAANSDVKIPSQKAVKTYTDGLVLGLLDYRGGYDASVNTFPASGGSGTAGAILKGDTWVISVAGTLGGVAIQAGDSIIANVDTPGQTTGNWNKVNTNIAYVPEDAANKVTSISGASTDTQYPSAKLLYDKLALYQPLDADLTTIAGLTDPNADRILFWDDSAGSYAYLAPGNSIAITTTTIDTIQDIRTTATPQFAKLGIGAAADATRLLLVQGDVSGGVATINRTNSSTNSALGTAIFRGTSAGDMTDGFGAAIQFAIQDTAGVENIIASIQALRNGADNSGRLNFVTALAGVNAINYTIDSRGSHVFSNPIVTSGTAPQFSFQPGAHTGLTASTESSDVTVALFRTVQFATGNITNQRAFIINEPTYAFAGASVITNAATFYISGAPIAGTNATITNSLSLWIGSGISQFGTPGTSTGSLRIAGATSGSTTLTVGATTSGTLTLPSATDTLVGKSTTDTLANKTLTAPVINASTLGGVHLFAEQGELQLDTVLSADGKYCGITEVVTAGETIAFGEIVYLKAADSQWYLADADADSSSGAVRIAIAVTSGTDNNTMTIMTYGKIRADAKFPTLTVGAPVYISTTSGAVQTAQPSGTDDVVRILGHAMTGDEMLFSPDMSYFTHT